MPLVDDNGTEVTTDTNPFGNNTEGNGLTGDLTTLDAGYTFRVTNTSNKK